MRPGRMLSAYGLRQTRRLILPALLTLTAGCWDGDDDDDDYDPSADARLSSLVVAQATLEPAFDRDTFDYAAEVANAVDSTTVTATAVRPDATIAVNGNTVASGVASDPIALAVGDSTVTVTVTAANGTSRRTYTVAVTRRPPPSSNAALLSLELTVARLDQIFDPGIMSYTASAGFFGASTSVIARPEDDGATLALNGDPLPPGEPSGYLPLDVGATLLEVAVTAEDGIGMRTYTVEVSRADAGAAGQEAYVKASNTGPDEFGTGVALSGDTLAVGAPGEGSSDTGIDGDQDDNSFADAGAVYVFDRAGTVWSQVAYVKASNSGNPDRFGQALALDADLLVVGAPREQSLSRGIDGIETDDSGVDVGAVYLFRRDGMGVWAQSAYVKASNPDNGDQFARALAVSGSRVIAGAPFEDSAASGVNGDDADDTASAAGAAYVFELDEDDWEQVAYLKASNPDAGDQFGRAVAMDGDLAAVGAPLEDGDATGVGGDQNDDSLLAAGAVYLFEADADGDWTQVAYVKASNPDAGDRFGASVALDGDLLAVAAPGEDSAAVGVDGDQTDDSLDAPGAVYVFERAGDGDWSQIAYIKASNPGTLDNFGNALALHGNVLVVGARSENSDAVGIGGDGSNDAALDAGAVYVFERDAGGDWAQIAYVKAANTDAGDEFGTALGVDGERIAVGAPFERSGDTGVGGDDGDGTVADAGAVYVFR